MKKQRKVHPEYNLKHAPKRNKSKKNRHTRKLPKVVISKEEKERRAKQAKLRQERTRKNNLPSQRKREIQRWMKANKIVVINGGLCKQVDNRAYKVKLTRKKRTEILRYIPSEKAA